MPIKSSKIRDARPAITAEAESEKGLFTSSVTKGLVTIKRNGPAKSNAFALKYEETQELVSLLNEIDGLLTKNQYGTGESLSDGYEAGNTRPVSKAKSDAPGAPEEATPSESGVVSIATQGTAQPEVTQEPDLASSQVDADNPFA